MTKRNTKKMRGLTDFVMSPGPLGWFTVCYLSLGAFVVFFFWGHASSLNQIEDACFLAGEPYDSEYRLSHAPNTYFPISYPCNEDYDLVSWWVNPVVAIFAVVLAFSLLAFVFTLGRLVRSKVRWRSPQQYGG